MKRHQRVLIYRLGSLGDTLVALPALRLIAQAFPDADRWVLTNFSINSKAPSMHEVLYGTGLVYGYLEYPVGTRDLKTLFNLRRKIRKFNPDVLIYLMESRGLLKSLRDTLFFHLCGIRRIVGVPYTAKQRNCQPSNGKLYEYEGARLARCISEFGNVRLDDPAVFGLAIGSREMKTAQTAVSVLNLTRPLLAISIGTKVDVNDWGEANWSALLSRLSDVFPSWSLVMLGAEVEWRRSDVLSKFWKGQSLNLCGQLSVHDSAAVLKLSRLFLGHDSGPMHLAASVGTPCVAIFSARNLPGVWFPAGSGHRVIYHSVECRDCGLDICEKYQKKCITSISVDEVIEAVTSLAKEVI